MEATPREAPLCWAQHWLWLQDTPTVRKGGPSMAMVGAVDAPPGLPLPVLRAALAGLLRRHEALRTVYRIDSGGLPTQVVLPAAEPDLTVVDLDGVPAGSGPDLLAEHLPTAIDATREPPVRVVAGAVRDEVRQIVFAIQALAVDGTSLAILRGEFEELVAAAWEGREPALAAAAWHPVDQGLAESSGSFAQRNQRALREWCETLARAPHSTLPFSWRRARPDATSLETSMLSRRFADQCRAAASRHRVSPPTIYLSLLVILLIGWTRHRACVIGSVVANRWEPALRASVGRYANIAHLLVELPGEARFADVIRRVWVEQARAYRHGVYDPGAYVMALARESSRIGARHAAAVDYEYHDYAGGMELGDGEPGPDDPWVRQVTDPGQTQNLKIDIHPAGESVRIGIRAPTTLLPEAAARDFLGRLDSLLDTLLAAPDTPLAALMDKVDLPRPWEGARWVSVRNAWINLDDVTGLLCGHPGVTAARVVVAGPTGTGDPELVAYAAVLGPVTAGDLDEYLRDVVSHHPTAMVPSRYALCRQAPADPADEAAWRSLAAAEPSPVARARPENPWNQPEQALAAAFQAHHPGQPVRMWATYAELGGEFLRIPAVLRELEEAGYGGVLRYPDLIGMAPLRQLAAKLART